MPSLNFWGGGGPNLAPGFWDNYFPDLDLPPEAPAVPRAAPPGRYTREPLQPPPLTEEDLRGSLYVMDPALGEPLDPEERDAARVTFEEAKAISEEIEGLRLVLDDPAQTRFSAEEVALLRPTLAGLEEITAELNGFVAGYEARLAELEALDADAVAEIEATGKLEVEYDACRGRVVPAGASGLGASNYTIQVPYLPRYDVNTLEPTEQALRIKPPTGDSYPITPATHHTGNVPEGIWIAASPANATAIPGPVYPAYTSLYAYARGNNEDDRPRDFRAAAYAVEGSLLARGKVEQVWALREGADPGLGNKIFRAGDGAPFDLDAFRAFRPQLPLFCAVRLYGSQAVTGVLRRGAFETVYGRDESKPVGWFGLQYGPNLDPEATSGEDWQIRRWLLARCPKVAYIRQRSRSDSAWGVVKGQLLDTLSDLVEFLDNPYVIAVITVVTFGGGAALIPAIQGAGPALQAMQAVKTGVSTTQAQFPGAWNPLVGPSSQPLQAGIDVAVGYRLATNPDRLDSDLARMVMGGAIFPGMGPVAAIVFPREANRVLQKMTAEAFFTVPGFTSLAVFAEWNRKRRAELTALLAGRMGSFYDQVIEPVVGPLQRVLGAIAALNIPIVSQFALGLSFWITVWRTAYETQLTWVKARAATDGIRAYMRIAIDELTRQADELRAKLKQVRAVRLALELDLERERCRGGSKITGPLVGAAVLAVGLALSGRKR